MIKATTEKLNDQINEVSDLIAELSSLAYGDNLDAAKDRLRNAVVEMITMVLARKNPRIETRRASMYERALNALATAKAPVKRERAAADEAGLAHCLDLCARIGAQKKDRNIKKRC